MSFVPNLMQSNICQPPFCLAKKIYYCFSGLVFETKNKTHIPNYWSFRGESTGGWGPSDVEVFHAMTPLWMLVFFCWVDTSLKAILYVKMPLKEGRWWKYIWYDCEICVTMFFGTTMRKAQHKSNFDFTKSHRIIFRGKLRDAHWHSVTPFIKHVK